MFGSKSFVFMINLFSHPLCSIAWVKARELNNTKIHSASSLNIIILDLEKNLWLKLNHFNLAILARPVSNLTNKSDSKKKTYLQISFLKRYTRKVVLTCGCLNDLQIFKLIQILYGLDKFTHQPKIILIQIKAFLFQISNHSKFTSSKISFSQAFELFIWLEKLKVENNPPRPQIGMNIVNRICKAFYGKNLSALIRKIYLMKTMNELIKTDDTILSIGTRAGYRNRDNFITAFKNEFETTPGALRLFYQDHYSDTYERL